MVSLNCLQQIRGSAIVHKKDALADAPQRSSAELVTACLALANVVG